VHAQERPRHQGLAVAAIKAGAAVAHRLGLSETILLFPEVAAVSSMTPRPVIATAGGIKPENAGAFVRAGADVLVTSWPYTAGPADVAVEIAPTA
jgi:molybdenum transport protein